MSTPENFNTTRPGLARPDVFQFGEDTAKYILRPDVQFERPWIAVPGGSAFIFPVGIEGFEHSGSAEIAVHKYLGDDEIDVSVVHRDEPRFTLSGQLPGKTAVANMLACKAVLVAKTPERGKILHLPFILPRIQYVVVQDYDFTHSADDRTETIAYQISFLKIGTGQRLAPGEPDQPTPNPEGEDVGDSQRLFRVRQGYRTLRAVSKKVYGNADKWLKLFNLNKGKLNDLGITKREAPTAIIPIGTMLKY